MADYNVFNIKVLCVRACVRACLSSLPLSPGGN